MWNVNRILLTLLTPGYLVLLLEIRTEHQAVLANAPIAWTPIVYSGLILIASVIVLLVWNALGRRVLFWLFALGLIVGVVGFLEHNGDDMAERIAFVASVWTQPPPEHRRSPGVDNQNRPAGTEAPTSSTMAEHDQHIIKAPMIPPFFAPLAFAGLGLLGMCACSRSMQCGEKR